MLLNPQLPDAMTTAGAAYPAFAASLPQFEIGEGRYLVRFVRSNAELDEILRLRFEVFNLELAEGLEASFATGRDEDRFDYTCHHLGVWDIESRRAVGTYRVQTSTMAAAGGGFYSAGEFDLLGLPMDLIDGAIELGRACIALEHRNTQVLYLLWKGLAAYLQHNHKRFLFGCCSLTSQDTAAGSALFDLLQREGWLHPSVRVFPQPECDCRVCGDEPRIEAPAIPKLFRTYLRFGAKVCGPPAIDRQFGTIDYFVLFDIAEMNAFSRRMFFGA